MPTSRRSSSWPGGTRKQSTVASAGIEAAKAAGLEAVYGNILRGNAADSLFLLGRWEEARAMSMTALEWLPAGINFLNALVSLATVEIELSAGEAAGRLLGQTLLELEAVRDAQQAVPLHLASASFALWRGDLADARRAADRGWSLVRETEDWILAARTAAAAIEVEAAGRGRGARAPRPGGSCRRPRARPRCDPCSRGDRQAPRRRLRPSGRAGWPTRGCRRRRPIGGASTARDDPATWTAVGDAWVRAPHPVRDRPRPLARSRGDARVRCRPRRSGGRPDPAARSRRHRH